MFLYCCTAVETVAPSLSLSYSRLFSGIYNGTGGGIQSVLFNRERGGGGWGRGEGKGRGGSSTPSPPPPPRLHMHPRALRERGDVCTCAPWPLFPGALDPGRPASSVFFDSRLQGSSVDPLSCQHVHLLFTEYALWCIMGGRDVVYSLSIHREKKHHIGHLE